MNDVLLRLEKLKSNKAALQRLSAREKNEILVLLAQKLKTQEAEILAANKKDLQIYQQSSTFQSAFLDRLTLTSQRIEQMTESLLEVAKLPDPVGAVVDARQLANGLQLKRVRSPLGVIFLIFESRPNVITEAFSLAFKAGNCLLLKGGKESAQTSQVIFRLISETLSETGLNSDLFWGLAEASRQTTDFLLKQNKLIDVLIPRGGDGLIEYVTQNSRIPMIKNDRGLCHIYVHEKANTQMALEIIDNAKTQRPSVCNSVETVLIDTTMPHSFSEQLLAQLRAKGVELYVCSKLWVYWSGRDGVFLADEKTFDTEYLDLKVCVKLVDGIEEAIAHIEKHGSRHSEAIVTADPFVAKRFQDSIDAAAVYWNASTRFTDGGQFGLGAEIGISTQKLHVRGPVDLDALTSVRWIIEGSGQVR